MGWTIAGTEADNQCFCGNKAPSRIVDAKHCNTPCKGNSQQICGGSWKLYIYHLFGEFRLRSFRSLYIFING